MAVVGEDQPLLGLRSFLDETRSAADVTLAEDKPAGVFISGYVADQQRETSVRPSRCAREAIPERCFQNGQRGRAASHLRHDNEQILERFGMFSREEPGKALVDGR